MLTTNRHDDQAPAAPDPTGGPTGRVRLLSPRGVWGWGKGVWWGLGRKKGLVWGVVGLVVLLGTPVGGQDLTTDLALFLRDLRSQTLGVVNTILSVTATQAGIATTSTDGVVVTNTTAATSGATVQISPRMRLCGTAWNSSGAASETDCWKIEAVPATVAGTTTVSLQVARSVAGGAYGSTVTISSGGSITAGLNLTAAAGGVVNWTGRANVSSPADGEITTGNNAQTVSAGVRARYIIEAVTATKAPSATENNECYTNTGDADGTTFTLPDDPTAGSFYCFVATVAQLMEIDANTGESVVSNGTKCANFNIGAAIGESLGVIAATGGSGAVWTPLWNNGGFTCS